MCLSLKILVRMEPLDGRARVQVFMSLLWTTAMPMVISRIKNDGGIALEDNVYLPNKNLTGLNELRFEDPGQDGSINWNGTAARIYVSPLDNSNTDGYLRIQNDGGIALEDHVYLPNKNLKGLNVLEFEDPGADGAIRWKGTGASIYVSPLDNANSDGYLRIKNDGGIALEDNVYLPNKNLTGLNELRFNDPGSDGAIRWDGTAAQIYVSPLNNDNSDGYLRLINDGGISLESNVSIAGQLTVAGKYQFYNGPGNVIHYFPPTGGEYTLDMDSGASNT